MNKILEDNSSQATVALIQARVAKQYHKQRLRGGVSFKEISSPHEDIFLRRCTSRSINTLYALLLCQACLPSSRFSSANVTYMQLLIINATEQPPPEYLLLSKTTFPFSQDFRGFFNHLNLNHLSRAINHSAINRDEFELLNSVAELFCSFSFSLSQVHHRKHTTAFVRQTQPIEETPIISATYRANRSIPINRLNLFKIGSTAKLNTFRSGFSTISPNP